MKIPLPFKVQLLLLVGCFFSLAGFSQVQPVTGVTLIDDVSASMATSSQDASRATTMCTQDTVRYPLAKANGLQALSINNATSASAVAQYYDAPQAITVSGLEFYSWKPDLTGGSSIVIDVELYLAGADSAPTGAPLRTTTITIDTTFGTGALNTISKEAIFTTPVTVTAPYCMVISNSSATNISVVFNDWNTK